MASPRARLATEVFSFERRLDRWPNRRPGLRLSRAAVSPRRPKGQIEIPALLGRPRGATPQPPLSYGNGDTFPRPMSTIGMHRWK